MLTGEMIFSMAVNPDIVIGIGARKDATKVETSAAVANEKGYGLTRIYKNPGEMVMDLLEGEIQAAVRGDMGSNDVMSAIKEGFGVDRVMRVAVLEPREEGLFFFGPVGIDEGWNIEEKRDFITLGIEMLERMGIEPSIGILSGGRLSDIGRNPVVDRTIKDAEEIVLWGRDIGLDIEHDEILIEKAASSRNFILAPDGISGNLIFRTLHFLGGGRAMGAPVINIDRVFIDTSRAKLSYVDSIALASAMVGKGHSQEFCLE
jgi:putative methanogen marker protein 4